MKRESEMIGARAAVHYYSSEARETERLIVVKSEALPLVGVRNVNQGPYGR